MSSNYRPLTGKSKHRHTSAVQIANKALTLFCALFFVVCIFCSFSTPVGTRLRSPRFLRPNSQKCDPFSLPGFVDSSSGSDELGAWRTFDPSCQPAGILDSLVSTLELNKPQGSYSAFDNFKSRLPRPRISSSDLAAILTNRTVLLIGDHQVDKTLVSHVCMLLGRKLSLVDKNHPWGHSMNTIPPKHGFTPDGSTGVLGHYCYVHQYDLLITSVYSFGADTTNFWKDEKMYNAPGLFEDRVTDLWKPYLAAMGSREYTSPQLPPPRKSSQPDLIFFNSGLWDLARWARHDIDSGSGLIENLEEERLSWWRSRNVDILSAIRNAWPKARIVWRNTHFPLASEASTVEWFLGVEGQNKKNHPLYHSNRIAQLNSAQKATLEPHGDDQVKGESNRSARLPKNIFAAPFAEIMMGQDQHLPDPLNPSLKPGGALFAEMMFWHLREVAYSSWY